MNYVYYSWLFRATIIQHQSSKLGQVNMGNVALPAVLRAGDASGNGSFSENQLQKAQFSQLSQGMHENQNSQLSGGGMHENGHSPALSTVSRDCML